MRVLTDNGKLEERAKWVRRQVFEMIIRAGRGHMGGSFSCSDILVALYHGGVLRVDPNDPGRAERDRFIFSKGHSVEALYAVLADRGFFARDELTTYGSDGSMLGGHPDNRVPGIEVSTGSLGHGLGIAAGLALSAKLTRESHMIYALLGDGECYEGSVWESAMFAAHHELNNLVAIVDRNGQVTLDYTERINRLDPFVDKWKAFGWDVTVVDGHSFEELLGALKALATRRSQKPLTLIANTVKGKGVYFMEGDLNWHHNVPRGDDLELARKELGLDS